MIAYDVEQRGAAWCVKREFDQLIPIAQGGKPAVFRGGWVPTRVLSGLGPANVLALRNLSGQTAVWFLDSNYHFETNLLERLADEERTEFVDRSMRCLGKAWQELVVLATPTLDDETRSYLELGGSILRDVVRFAGKEPYPRATVVNMDGKGGADAPGNHSRLMHEGRINSEVLDGLFKRDFLNDAIRATIVGMLILPSPVDGQDLATDTGLCLTPSTFAYRFIDTRYNLTFYVLVSLWRAVIVALYFPSLSLTVGASSNTVHMLQDFFGADIDAAIFDHVINYGTELQHYLRAPSRSVTYVYSQEHLGHHLWNELTGLRAVATRISKPQIPEILVINPARSEMYGKIDEIFPELSGRVDRTPHLKESLAHFAYQNGRCLFYPTGEYVSADLAQRIIAVAESEPGIELAKVMAERLSSQGFLIVLLGLRVENRTLVDSVGFFVDVINVLRECSERVAVVIDGHNGAGNGRFYRSHAEDLTERSPAEVELGIVEEIRAQFTADDNLQIISTVGEPVSASIVWCRRAAFFVTPWGAGLAKYRWICNQRGLVVASQRFFRYAGARTVHLYDSSQFMEAPTPLNFISSEDVEDSPDTPLLIGLKDENRVNFTVKHEAIRRRLIQLMLGIGVTTRHDGRAEATASQSAWLPP